MSSIVGRGVRLSGLSKEERLDIYGNSRITLCQEKEGDPGRDYLLRQRGLDWGTIAKFRLGFVPFRLFHPMAGRIVMPIFDCYDNLIALSVRPAYKVLESNENILAAKFRVSGDYYLYEDEHGNARRMLGSKAKVREEDQRYWNESFPKGEHLFGFNLAKRSIVKWGFAILVEGQMDVIAMHSYGITNAVGLMGGRFTPFQAKLLKKWTTQVVIIMDGDDSGQGHARQISDILRIYENPIWKIRGKNFRNDLFDTVKHLAVQLPVNMDPDSFVRRSGGMAMRQRINEASLRSNMRLPENWLSRVTHSA